MLYLEIEMGLKEISRVQHKPRCCGMGFITMVAAVGMMNILPIVDLNNWGRICVNRFSRYGGTHPHSSYLASIPLQQLWILFSKDSKLPPVSGDLPSTEWAWACMESYPPQLWRCIYSQLLTKPGDTTSPLWLKEKQFYGWFMLQRLISVHPPFL